MSPRMWRVQSTGRQPAIVRAAAGAADGAAAPGTKEPLSARVSRTAAPHHTGASGYVPYRAPEPRDLALLEHSQLYASLSGAARKVLASRLVRRRLERGQTLTCEGDVDGSLHIVLSGRLKVVATSLDGDEFMVTLLRPGECAGALSAVDGGPSPVRVVAHAPAEVLTLFGEDVRVLALRSAEFAFALARELTAALRMMGDRLGDAYFYDLRTRIARCLASLDGHYGTDSGSGTGIAIPLTQAELAAMLGAGRSRINKILNDLQDDGIIRLSRRTMTIVDEERLRRCARLDPGDNA